MKYKYIGAGAFTQGLPAADLDDALLSDQERALLREAVSAGVYEAQPSQAVPVLTKSKKGDAAGKSDNAEG